MQGSESRAACIIAPVWVAWGCGRRACAGSCKSGACNLSVSWDTRERYLHSAPVTGSVAGGDSSISIVVQCQDTPQPAQACSVMERPAEGLGACADTANCCPDRSGRAPRAQVVWLQSGISEPRFEEALARAGIRVVPDRCLKVDRARALSRL